MPIYLITHPEAHLTEEKRQQLIAGLDSAFGGEEGAAIQHLADLP